LKKDTLDVSGLEPDLMQEWLDAESAGSFYATRIKDKGYPTTKF
jgi:hypothetical protein